MLSFSVFLLALLQAGQAARPAGVESIGPSLEVVSLGIHVQEASRQIAGLIFLMVTEARQHADLNGDGDLTDVVVHAAHLSGGMAIDLGFAGSIPPIDVPFFTALGHVLMKVDEAHQGGADLNGDGDALDQVYHLVDLSTLRVTNLGLTAIGGLAIEGGQALLGAFESAEGSDLNGDGDALDRLVFVLDLGTGLRTLLGPGNVVAFRDGHAFISEQEWTAGADLNGDGDLLDELFHALDLVNGTSERLKVVSSRNGSWKVVAHTLFSSPKETDLGFDLNGDGDRGDSVLHAFDLLERSSRNLGSSAPPNFIVYGPWILGFLYESLEGRDFNLDGDRFDSFWLTYDESGQMLTRHVPDTAMEGSLRASLPEDLANTINRESGEDVNGDGDGLDSVPQLYDFAIRRRSRPPYALANSNEGQSPAILLGGQLSMLVGEGGEGQDLNGDGDLADAVLHVYEPRTGRAQSSGLATRPTTDFKGDEYWRYWPGPGGVLFPVSEVAQGGVDLDGNGDVRGDVLHVIVARDGVGRSITNLRLRAGGSLQPRVLERWIGLPLQETAAGQDLDGDGFVSNSRVPLFHHIASATTLNVGVRGEILAMDEEHVLVSLLIGQVPRLHRVTLVAG